MKLPYYQLNAFVGNGFKGNPAGVCLIEQWPENQIMQEIAFENNLSETAFVLKNGNSYEIRWFTPAVEVDLCGHATLASAYVLMNYIDKKTDSLIFQSKSGELKVEKDESFLTMNFPADTINQVPLPVILKDAFHLVPKAVYKGKTDYMLVLESEEQLRKCKPEFNLLMKSDCRGIIATASGKSVDFVSRFFAPQSGIYEDPVTGSAHTTLVPYWSEKLGKKRLIAQQLSERGGEIFCFDYGQKIGISGRCILYIEGFLHI